MASRSVRILDISAGGVLLASSVPADVGTRGRLSLNIAGHPLATDVEIRRVFAPPDQAGFRLGAMFVGLTRAQQDTIERFTRA